MYCQRMLTLKAWYGLVKQGPCTAYNITNVKAIGIFIQKMFSDSYLPNSFKMLEIKSKTFARSGLKALNY